MNQISRITNFVAAPPAERDAVIARISQLGEFAHRVEAYCAARGTSVETLGRYTMNYKLMLPRLWEKARQVADTMDAVDAYMTAHPAPAPRQE